MKQLITIFKLTSKIKTCSDLPHSTVVFNSDPTTSCGREKCNSAESQVIVRGENSQACPHYILTNFYNVLIYIIYILIIYYIMYIYI